MPEANLITLTDPRSSASEAYRTLRTNLMFMSLDNPLSAFAVTSPVPSEGKSTVAANLSVALAQGGHETILVDCDLRQPSQHSVWGLDNARGLTTMLLDSAAFSNPPLQPCGIDHLSVLTSGPLPPNPADVLGSRRMDEVIQSLKERAEFVLFDVPPTLAVTDAALMGLKTDGVLLVLKTGSSRRDHAARAKEELERLNVHIIGTVLVNVPRDAAMGTYYTA